MTKLNASSPDTGAEQAHLLSLVGKSTLIAMVPISNIKRLVSKVS